jgi:hypothetical protein
MSDLQAIADRVEIEALRGEFTDTVNDAGLRPPRVTVHPGRHGAAVSSLAGVPRFACLPERRKSAAYDCS